MGFSSLSDRSTAWTGRGKMAYPVSCPFRSKKPDCIRFSGSDPEGPPPLLSENLATIAQYAVISMKTDCGRGLNKKLVR